ncbi:MAG: hypothetical protein PWP04_1077 [Candidatus Atribacteria bacterium]|nr:hypothetical protein [Candidatus Atribacteria bacterium]
MSKNLKVVRKFDPWKNPWCTCPEKYTLNPYTGCAHGCRYCYISAFIPHAFELREKAQIIARVEHDFSQITKLDTYLSLSNSSDPYPPREKEREITRKIIILAQKYQIPILILTKSDLVARDQDLLKNMPAAVSITLTTLEEDLAHQLEPNAPSPAKRIEAIKALALAGIPVMVRIDPIILGINHQPETWKKMVEAVSPWVYQVTASTFKPRPDSWQRVAQTFSQTTKFRQLYSEKKGNSWYLREKLRETLLTSLKELVNQKNLPFATCREGMPELNDTTCDGSGILYHSSV